MSGIGGDLFNSFLEQRYFRFSSRLNVASRSNDSSVFASAVSALSALRSASANRERMTLIPAPRFRRAP
jgi:hypothetical protein